MFGIDYVRVKMAGNHLAMGCGILFLRIIYFPIPFIFSIFLLLIGIIARRIGRCNLLGFGSSPNRLTTLNLRFVSVVPPSHDEGLAILNELKLGRLVWYNDDLLKGLYYI